MSSTESRKKGRKKDNFARKPVAFNKDNPRQKRLLEYAEKQGNFSDYVKGLIQRDMEGGWGGPPSHQEKLTKPEEIEYKDFADNAVDSFDAF